MYTISLSNFFTGEAVYTYTQETAIRTAILGASYDKYARPTEQTVISASLNLLAIDELVLIGLYCHNNPLPIQCLII